MYSVRDNNHKVFAKGVQRRRSCGAPQQIDKRKMLFYARNKNVSFMPQTKNKKERKQTINCLFFSFFCALSGRLGGSSGVFSLNRAMLVNNANITKESLKSPTSQNTHLCSH